MHVMPTCINSFHRAPPPLRAVNVLLIALGLLDREISLL